MLVEDERVKLITFTGSGPVGWKLRERAARKRVNLELGNATPVIVATAREMIVADGGVIVRFKFPGLNKAENLTTGFVDRELKDVHAGHLCYATLSQADVTLSDRKTGSMNLAVKKKHADDAAAKRKPDPAFEAMLKKKSQVTPLKADQEWHVFTLVTEGDEMRFSLDGKLIASHRSEGYAHEMKRWFSFLANSTVWIDDVKIYKVR